MDPLEREMRVRAKAMMRRRARSVRSSVPAAALAERSARIVERLAASDALAQADRIALFWPIEKNKEVDLRPLFERLRGQHKRVAFPRLSGPGLPMDFAWVGDASQLEERGRGFAEPSRELPAADRLDAIVVPALVIDPRGHRLGYGAGYYDRTLPDFCPPARAIAVAFDFQLAPDVPSLEEDVAVDAIVTDARTIVVSKPASR